VRGQRESWEPGTFSQTLKKVEQVFFTVSVDKKGRDPGFFIPEPGIAIPTATVTY
jgi:hypothetical protein